MADAWLRLTATFTPTLESAWTGGLCGIALFVAAGQLVAWLNGRGWRVGDTRKIFHLIIFSGAAGLRIWQGAGAVLIYGVIVAGGVVAAVASGPKSGLYRALARPADAPHERWFILSPLISTAAGGVLAQLLAGDLSRVAYLVAGWGDAVGEPVGIRWGRHQFRVPTLSRIPAQRSLEGCLAVFCASTIAASLALAASGPSLPETLISALILGGVATLVEAVSPHGWDNLTLLTVIAALTPGLVAA